jgi:hypothetical protein
VGTDRTIQTLADAILEKLSYIEGHSSKTSEMLATGVVNNVLDVRTYFFNTEGFVTLGYGATIGSIEVTNHTDATIYVSPSPASGAATPAMPRVDAGLIRNINIASRNVTLYGTAGGAVGVQVFTRGTLGGNSLTAVNGGAP